MEVKHAFTVLWDEGVEINQHTNALGNSISDATDYEASIRVPTEDYIR